jgi:hypothetical protein
MPSCVSTRNRPSSSLSSKAASCLVLCGRQQHHNCRSNRHASPIQPRCPAQQRFVLSWGSFHSRPVTNRQCYHTVVDAPFGRRSVLEYLIAKHPKVMANVSTVLITVGSIVLRPGMTASAASTTPPSPSALFQGIIHEILPPKPEFSATCEYVTATLPPLRAQPRLGHPGPCSHLEGSQASSCSTPTARYSIHRRLDSYEVLLGEGILVSGL